MTRHHSRTRLNAATRVRAVVLVIQWILQLSVIPHSASSFIDFNSIINLAKEAFDTYRNEPTDERHLLPIYDFIVVGAGTAGCVIANRLTENPDWNVLLIESGGQENYLMDIPILAAYNQLGDANWNYKTEPSNEYCIGFKNKQCHWPRGKVMGGSSVLNYMIYTRGTEYDYNNWENLGNVGWGWNEVLPYFKKVENFNIPFLYDNYYHSKGGYLNVEHARYHTNKGRAWVQAVQELGFKYGDYNGATPSAVSFLQASMKNGTRHSSSKAYLHPIKNRKNLHVSKNSLVTKLIFDQQKENVIGVEFEKHNLKHTILIKREVILAAGAINSPQLLMLSGIGPKNHLESLRIPVVKHLPVGQNLMDHIAAGGLQFVVEKQSDSPTFYNFFYNIRAAFQWAKSRDGILSIPGGTEALLFMELNDKYNTSGWPDVELLFVTGGLNADPIIKHAFGIDSKIFRESYGPLKHSDVFMIFPMLMRPQSKGTVLLNSTNPKDYPLLYPNYFQYQEDLDKIVAAINIAIDISKQAALKKIKAKLYDVPIKECLKYGPFGSSTYFMCQARMFTCTIYHLSGTCKMGPVGDPSAVVDPRLRVHGVGRLRVIDASIMPEIVSSHINAPTFMIAEKGADMIKEDWMFFN